MRHSFLASIFTLAFGLLSQMASAETKLESMNYPEARGVILGFGWKPFRGNCLANESEGLCKQFPELINCTQGQPQICILRFSKGSRCLEVTTRGGYLEEGSAPVDGVVFTKTKCSKSL